jgi:hypothetical protein
MGHHTDHEDGERQFEEIESLSNQFSPFGSPDDDWYIPGREEGSGDVHGDDVPRVSLTEFSDRRADLSSSGNVRRARRGGLEREDRVQRQRPSQQTSRPPFPVPSSTSQHTNSVSHRVVFDPYSELPGPFPMWMGDDTPGSSTTDPAQSPELSNGYLLDGEGGEHGEYESDESDLPGYSPPPLRVEGIPEEYYGSREHFEDILPQLFWRGDSVGE